MNYILLWERGPELRPLLGGCPYLRGSFIRGSTVCIHISQTLYRYIIYILLHSVHTLYYVHMYNVHVNYEGERSAFAIVQSVKKYICTAG